MPLLFQLLFLSLQSYPSPSPKSESFTFTISYLLRAQMVNPNIHNRPNDTNLDLPRLPNANNRTTRRLSKRKVRPRALAARYYRRHHDSGRWILGLDDGLLGFHISTHDAKAAQGEYSPGNVCFCRSEWVYGCGDCEYGC